MGTTRREFMRRTGSLAVGAAGLTTFGPGMVFGKPAPAPAPAPGSSGAPGSRGSGGQPTLVVLYLRGGSDTLSAMIPFSDRTYYNIRPTIAIPAPGSGAGVAPGQSAIPLSRHFGFHPSMRGLARLYKKKQMAAIINAGSTHPTRSHFDAQDFMERAAPGIKSVTEGWLNRYLTDTRTGDDSALRAVSFQPVLPRSLRGEYPALAVPDGEAQQAAKVFSELYSCEDAKTTARAQAKPESEADAEVRKHERIVDAGAQGIARLDELNTVLGNEAWKPTVRYPDTDLGAQFRDIAKVVKANVGLEIAAVDYNGWDHHAMQGASGGVFGRMMGNVSDSIEAFVNDLGPAIDRTVVLTMSEFGRTARENGNNGSDHGHGGYMLAIGGRVNGGKVYGKWTGLSSRSLHEQRDLPVYTDFRDVFAEVLAGLFGFVADEHQFFPEYDANAKPLGLIKTS